MPSTYAHFRAGQRLRAQLAGAPKAAVEAHPELYNIGLHGPDILFYYEPYHKKHVSTAGYRQHEKSGASFFSFAAKVVRQGAGRAEDLAYLYGVLCHFALDVRCHGLIGEKMAQSGLSHAEVEVELDRALLARDGFAPASAHLVGHIVPSRRNAVVIEKFYPGVSAAEMEKALRGFVFYGELLRAPSPLKRQALFAALRLAGCYRDIHGMVVRTAADPRCADSTEKLLTLYERGEALALHLIEEYEAYLAGTAPLDETLRWNFESRLP